MIQTGELTVISGCMFASKTDTLISLLNREKYRKRHVLAIKHARDIRYATDEITTHDGTKLPSRLAQSARDVDLLLEEFCSTNNVSPGNVSVGIEEVQFFDDPIADLCHSMTFDGVRVFVAGLNLDSFGHPFGPMPQLLAFADRIIKLQAQCADCGADAAMTFRKTPLSEEQVFVGGEKEYDPLCKKCYKSR